MTETAVRERPILFSGPMVRAILEGRKTQTRRVVKPQPETMYERFDDIQTEFFRTEAHRPVLAESYCRNYCPYGQPGDRLYVRETTCIAPKNFATPDDSCIPDSDGDLRYVSFKADGHPEDAMRDYGLKWTPAIHVPRWASRITLEVTDVRVDRVRLISENDAKAEGVDSVRAFRELWDSLNAKRGASWEVNPWVWIVEFQKV